jgi:molybdate transport system substrate-binding protein
MPKGPHGQGLPAKGKAAARVLGIALNPSGDGIGRAGSLVCSTVRNAARSPSHGSCIDQGDTNAGVKIGGKMGRKTLLVVLLVGLVLTGCKSSSPASPGKVQLTVAAGAKFSDVFPKIGALYTRDHQGVTFNFVFDEIHNIVAGITQGQSADVFAGPSTEFGDQLVTANKIDAYKVFGTNPFVLITTMDNPAGIATAQELATKPVKLLIASDKNTVTAPFTRTVLTNLETIYGSGYSTAVLSKVVGREDMISSIASKVERGEADAGLVFASDAIAFKVNRIALPAEAQPYAALPIAVVKASKNASMAQQFINFVLTPPAQALLAQMGFGPPPA